jgi:hypothetical protein
MYDLINKIWNKSREEKCDIGVAYDKLNAEKGSVDEELKKAFEFLQENQVELALLRQLGRTEEIKVLCNMAVAGNKLGIRKYIIALYDTGVLER